MRVSCNSSSLSALRSERGSALLIALLLMAFLVILGMGLSGLIVDAVRLETTVVDVGKSYFAAEAGVERGLYFQENRLPGFEIEESYMLSNGAEVSYALLALSTHVPCEHRPEEWRALGIQQSVSWPLYAYDEDSEEGRHTDVSQFELQFKVDREGEAAYVNGNVLRWKIIGFSEDGGYTQAISGILPYTGGVSDVLSEQALANFYEGEPGGGSFVNIDQYSVREFLDTHDFNTLILTNVIELSDQLVRDPELNRLELELNTDFGSQQGTACEYALIESDARVGQGSQSLDAQIRLDSVLPVYDFALYQTE